MDDVGSWNGEFGMRKRSSRLKAESDGNRSQRTEDGIWEVEKNEGRGMTEDKDGMDG